MARAAFASDTPKNSEWRATARQSPDPGARGRFGSIGERHARLATAALSDVARPRPVPHRRESPGRGAVEGAPRQSPSDGKGAQRSRGQGRAVVVHREADRGGDDVLHVRAVDRVRGRVDRDVRARRRVDASAHRGIRDRVDDVPTRVQPEGVRLLRSPGGRGDERMGADRQRGRGLLEYAALVLLAPARAVLRWGVAQPDSINSNEKKNIDFRLKWAFRNIFIKIS